MVTRAPTAGRRLVPLLRRHAVWLTSAALVCIMVLAALLIGRAGLATAKQERLAERTNLLTRLIQYGAGAYDPETLAVSAKRVPFSPDDPVANRKLLANFMVNSTGDTATSAALVRLDGSLDSILPATARPPSISTLGATWAAARAGTPTRSPVLEYDGEPSMALAVPVGGTRRWGVLVITSALHTLSSQRFVDDLGTLGRGEGGLSMLDRNGRVMISWDAAALGRQQVDPAFLATLPNGIARRTGGGEGAAAWTTISVRQSDLTGQFYERDATLFGDLEAGQRQRDVALVVVLLLAVGGMVATTYRRLRAARRDRARMHALLAGAHDLILVVGAGGRLTFVSPNVTGLLGHPASSWVRRDLFQHVHPDDVPRLSRLIGDPERVGAARDIRFAAADGSMRWFDVQAGDVSSERLLTGVLLTCRDTAERKELEDRLFEQSRRDPLTGLANRALLTREIDARLLVPGQNRCTVLFLDLDGFKAVNDSHGHEAGDRLLVAVAGRLRRAARDGEVVARYGGDEFVVLLPRADEVTARQVADRVVAALTQPVTVAEGVAVLVGASVGVAAATPRVRSADVLLRAADRAMYVAKRTGGGVQVADPAWLDDSAWLEGSAPASGVDATQAPPTGSPPGARRGPRRSTGPADPHATGPRSFIDTGTLITLVATGLSIVAVAAIGLWGAGAAQDAAERQRVQERLDVVARVSDYASGVAGPDRLLAPLNAAPWRLDGSIVDVLVLRGVMQSSVGGPGAQAVLYRPDGTLLAGEPGAATLPVAPGSQSFAAAGRGQVGFEQLFTLDDATHVAYAVPLIRDRGDVIAVLLVSQRLEHSTSQLLHSLVGSLGFGEGGLSSVLPNGRVTHSWDPRLIGSQIVLEQDLSAVRPGTAQAIDTGEGTVTLAARTEIDAAAYPGLFKFMVLQQPTAAFYAGIRDRGRERDLALLGGVLLCLLGLGLGGVQWSRQEQQAHRRLHALLRNAHDIVLVTRDGRIDFVSSAVEELLHRNPERVLGARMEELVHPADGARARAFLQGRNGDTLRDVRLMRPDGGAGWFDLQRTDLSSDPDLGGVVLTCQEVGERRALRDQLAHLVQHDSLTGLVNRARFLEVLAALLHPNGSHLPCWLLFVDLDRFKPVNDEYGHDAGDAVLRTVARRLEQGLVHLPGALAARLGGDEFGVLLPNVGPAEATSIADALLVALAAPVPLWSDEGQTVRVGATIGVAQGRPGEAPAGVLRRADEAMYRGKKAGRGCYAVAG